MKKKTVQKMARPTLAGLQAQIDELTRRPVYSPQVPQEMHVPLDIELAAGGKAGRAGPTLATAPANERIGDAMLKDLENLANRLNRCAIRSENTADRLLGCEPSPPSPSAAQPEPSSLVAKFDAIVSYMRQQLNWTESSLDRLERI